ncbi:hypothetical protein F4824DRAFT_498366 [Ustulina deusta]|nr:hypothetical protein F4824DRAFT_498366 [Ustulina deusta]
MADAYLQSQFFVTNQDYEIWKSIKGDLENIALLKITLLRDSQTETSPFRPSHAPRRSPQELEQYQPLKDMLERASHGLREQKEIVERASVQLAQQAIHVGGYSHTLMTQMMELDVRMMTIEMENRRIWRIPSALRQVEILSHVLAVWAGCGDPILVALAQGRPPGAEDVFIKTEN